MGNSLGLGLGIESEFEETYMETPKQRYERIQAEIAQFQKDMRNLVEKVGLPHVCMWVVSDLHRRRGLRSIKK